MHTVLDFQQRIHAVALKLLKAIFIGLGRDTGIIDEVCLFLCCETRPLLPNATAMVLQLCMLSSL
jgi:hypothetical protein